MAKNPAPASPSESPETDPSSDQPTLLADTSATRNKGVYYHNHGAVLAGIPVFVVKRYTKRFHDLDGNGYNEEVGDLSRTPDGEPFVTECPVRDKPADGYWVPE